MSNHRTNGTAKRRIAPDWVPRFLRRLRECGNIRAACEAAAVPRTTVYSRRDNDEEFRVQMSTALEEAIDFLELEAYRRATRRMDPSDTLLIFLLKANRPAKYRERHDVNLSGGVRMEVVEEIIDAGPEEENPTPSRSG